MDELILYKDYNYKKHGHIWDVVIEPFFDNKIIMGIEESIDERVFYFAQNNVMLAESYPRFRFRMYFFHEFDVEAVKEIASARHATFLALNLYQKDKYINYYTKEVVE